jgi:hypothetical protein
MDRNSPAARYAAGMSPEDRRAPHDSAGAVRRDNRRHLKQPEFFDGPGGVLMLRIPSDSTSEVLRKAREQDKERFADAWRRYKTGEAAPEYVRPTPTPAAARITPARFFMEGKTLMFEGPGDGNARAVRRARDGDSQAHPHSWEQFLRTQPRA